MLSIYVPPPLHALDRIESGRRMTISGSGTRVKRANRTASGLEAEEGEGAEAGLACHSRLSLGTMGALSRKSVGSFSLF